MNSNKLTIKNSSLAFVIGFLLCQTSVILAVCFSYIGYRLLNFNPDEFDSFLNGSIGYMIQILTLYLTMLLVFLFFNKGKENRITQKVKIKKVLLYICVAIISFLTLYPIITCFDSFIIKLGARINTLSYPLTTKNYFISLISLVVAPAICEELLFRGLIFKGLKKHGKIFSVLISSLMFTLYHMAISQTLYPLLMGLILGVIMYYEDNIYYCIAVHLTNNFLSLTLSYFKINLIFNHWSYIVLAIILLVGFLAIALSFVVKNRKQQEKQTLSKTDKHYLFLSLGIMIILWILSNFA